MAATLADIGRMVKRKFHGFEHVPDDELGRLVKARCRKAPAVPVEAVSPAPAPESVRPAESVPDEDLARHGKQLAEATDQATTPESPAGPDLEAPARAAALRLSGAARRDPDLKRLHGLVVDLVITAGAERVVARVFQRAAPKPSKMEAVT